MIALSAITVLALLNGFKAAPVTDSCVGHFDTISWGQNEGDSDYRRRIEADQAYFLEQGLCETTSTQAKPLKKRGGEDATSSAPVDETDVCPVFTHAPDVYEPAVFVPHTVMYQVMPPLAFKYGTGDVVKGVGKLLFFFFFNPLSKFALADFVHELIQVSGDGLLLSLL